MKRWLTLGGPLAALVLIGTVGRAGAAEPSIADVAEEVNRKIVKVFGAGGIRGLPSYGTGLVISGDGYILTANSHILDTQDLRVHTYDGTRYHCKVVCIEPELDLALIKIDTKESLDLPFFNLQDAARQPLAEPGTCVLAFSNQFQIATRNEPVSVQKGNVASYCKLHGRIGIFEAPYTGNVYVIDAITNNPGAAGGAVTDRRGRLLGIIGKELRNELTNTWINYALPIQAKIEIPQGDGTKITRTVVDLVELKEKYKPLDPNKKPEGGGGYHGIQLVQNVVDRTPPYVEDVEPGSPGEKAGLKPDDLIVYVDGLPVPSIQMFNEIIGKYRPGVEVKLEIRRGDKLNTVPLKLTDPPRKAKPAPPPQP
jgi:S1-C subfamily serine protease